MKLCLTLEEFGAIMGEHDFDAIILPTLKEDLSDLAHRLLVVTLAMAKRWCKSNKLNAFMAEAKRFHHLNAFCLCILAWFFFMHKTFRVDLGILHVVKNPGSGSPMTIVLIETLNGLDAIHREEVTFFVGSPLLQV